MDRAKVWNKNERITIIILPFRARYSGVFLVLTHISNTHLDNEILKGVFKYFRNKKVIFKTFKFSFLLKGL